MPFPSFLNRSACLTDIGEVDIKVPGELHIIETHAANDRHEGERAIEGLPVQLCGSVFHEATSFQYSSSIQRVSDVISPQSAALSRSNLRTECEKKFIQHALKWLDYKD